MNDSYKVDLQFYILANIGTINRIYIKIREWYLEIHSSVVYYVV